MYEWEELQCIDILHENSYFSPQPVMTNNGAISTTLYIPNTTKALLPLLLSMRWCHIS